MDVEEFNRKAKEIFENKVMPQIKNAIKTKTMTPEEKAIDLYNKMLNCCPSRKTATTTALIIVNEIMNTIEFSSQADELSKISYWNQVRSYIRTQ